MVYRAKPMAPRFWKKVDKRGEDECWPWLAGISKSGYGAFGVKVDEKNRMEGSNRVAFFLTHGYWPNHACHTCDDKLCCNPKHIYDGSNQTNADDKVERWRTGRLKIGIDQAETIIKLRGQELTQAAIAIRLGVHVTTIERFFAGKTKSVAHINPPVRP